MRKKASSDRPLTVDDVKALFRDGVVLAAFKQNKYHVWNEYTNERYGRKRAQFCIDYARNSYVAYLEEFGFKGFMQQVDWFTPDQEELDTFNDPTEVVKQAIIDKANSITIQDVYDRWRFCQPQRCNFRCVGIGYVRDQMAIVADDVIDAFYASQPVCDCYVD